jgi:hypothetical protein
MCGHGFHSKSQKAVLNTPGWIEPSRYRDASLEADRERERGVGLEAPAVPEQDHWIPCEHDRSERPPCDSRLLGVSE